MRVNCRRCGGESFVLKTHKHARMDVRKRACECGDTWETNEREVSGSRSTGNPRPRQPEATAEPPPGDARATNGSPLASRHSSDPDQIYLPSADQTQTPARVEPVVFSFDVVANDGKPWGLPQSKHAEFTAAFPSVDALAEYRKISAWLSSNPANRKTPRGMPAFLFRWLGRAQDRGGASPRLPLSSVPDPRCPFHRQAGTANRASRFPHAGCPECKHVSAARGSRQGDPTPAAAIVPATREELDSLKRGAG